MLKTSVTIKMHLQNELTQNFLIENMRTTYLLRYLLSIVSSITKSGGAGDHDPAGKRLV